MALQKIRKTSLAGPRLALGRGIADSAHVVTPADIQLIGNEVAIKWSDGAETFVSAPNLRAASPSASAKGEPDLFGRMHGGEGPRDFSGIGITSWKIVGNYAVQFTFSDGHRTGLYSYELLRRLGEGEA